MSEPRTTVALMTEPTQFKFERRLEGYTNDSIMTLDADQFSRLKAWSPRRRMIGLRVVFGYGTVLIATGGTAVTVEFSHPSTVVVSSPDGAGEIDGVGVGGGVHVQINALANELEAVQQTIGDELLTPNITIDHRGVIRHFAGVANLTGLLGQLISTRTADGEPPGRLIGIESVNPSGKLVGVNVTGLHASRLTDLGKLSVFSPDIESLYDLACPFDRLACRIRRCRQRGRFDPTEDQSSTPRERAHWFRDLHDAIGSMSVSASTRAAVRWCHALLEHEAIKLRRLQQAKSHTRRQRFGREAIESLGRWLHRCVGYGQRPSRAFACWMMTTAAVITWSAIFRTVESGLTGWVRRSLEVALSTLGVLRLGSSSDAGTLVHPGFEPVAYLLVGLPFIFFVISLREFFRSPLNPRSSTP